MEKKRKRRSTVPDEIWALVPEGCRVNKTPKKGTYQVYTAIDTYDKATKKKGEIRTYIGTIKDGIFTYTSNYLLKLKEEELKKKEEEIAALKAQLAAYKKSVKEKTETSSPVQVVVSEKAEKFT